ncbi:EF-hand [Canariomyces notabilis]|uniref:EF-hand n=1 Tax=Canariomyces notabilis TaxID=2074819 RepID=A0AAN6TMR8_9PEZI|nr:EF-hand [Canariomyces arenarius]
MAYNRPYNPDELPRFAEPEQKGGVKSPVAGSAPSSRYENKPPPPRPLEHRSNSERHAAQQPGGRLSPRQPPPPDRYGMSPPPTATTARPAHHNLPPASSRPPPSPSPRDGSADPTLLPLFRAVDKDGTGQLSEKELSAALVNGDWTAFDPQTVRMMIRMFDSDRSGTIGFEEFCGLWSFLASWRTLFDRFDQDRSGNISLDEFSNALVAFRYRLSDRFVELLFRTYDKRNEGVMSFDLFVQACISLKRMTDVFKRYDDDRDGYITLSFEDFLTEILRQLK